MGQWVDSFITKIFDAIMLVITYILNFIFATKFSTLLFGFLFMNFMGLIMMKLDKKYAKDAKRRIRESTLFLTAILFGSFGIFLGMKKYHHKTLHKSFTIGIPLIMVVQVVLIIYALAKGFLF